jgi:hypothetical protein
MSQIERVIEELKQLPQANVAGSRCALADTAGCMSP